LQVVELEQSRKRLQNTKIDLAMVIVVMRRIQWSC